jgi:predicted Holliday junction resolvase-like endonuclease
MATPFHSSFRFSHTSCPDNLILSANAFNTLSVRYLVTPGDVIVTYLTAGPVYTGINGEVAAVKCEHLTCREQQVLAIIIRRQVE